MYNHLTVFLCMLLCGCQNTNNIYIAPDNKHKKFQTSMVHSSQKFQYNKFMNELKKDIAKVDKVILEEQEDKRSKAPPLWYNEQHLRNLQYITPKEAMSLPQITLKH